MRLAGFEQVFDLVQQGEPAGALPGGGGGDAGRFERAVEFARAEDGVGEGEERKRGDAEVEGGVGEV